MTPKRATQPSPWEFRPDDLPPTPTPEIAARLGDLENNPVFRALHFVRRGGEFRRDTGQRAGGWPEKTRKEILVATILVCLQFSSGVRDGLIALPFLAIWLWGGIGSRRPQRREVPAILPPKLVYHLSMAGFSAEEFAAGAWGAANSAKGLRRQRGGAAFIAGGCLATALLSLAPDFPLRLHPSIFAALCFGWMIGSATWMLAAYSPQAICENAACRVIRPLIAASGGPVLGSMGSQSGRTFLAREWSFPAFGCGSVFICMILLTVLGLVLGEFFPNANARVVHLLLSGFTGPSLGIWWVARARMDPFETRFNIFVEAAREILSDPERWMEEIPRL